jgi:thioredoxin reductase (NADPH)
MTEYDLVIIGGGIVSFASAIYAGRLHLKTLIIGEKLGGTIVLADKVENYPGFTSISGQDLFDAVRKHAIVYRPDFFEEKVDKVQKDNGMFQVTSGKKVYFGKTVLFATGTDWRKLNIPGENEFMGNGVHYCALCDAFIYQDKVVAVVGGSDSAVREALMLTEFASKVYVIHRNDELSCEPANLKQMKENPKIECFCTSKVVEILGKEVVEKVIIEDESGNKSDLPLDGIFINIGHVPTSALCKALGVTLNEKQQIMVNSDCETNVPGVYAAGDVTNSRFKQSITGVAQGVSAVYAIYHFLKRDAPQKSHL